MQTSAISDEELVRRICKEGDREAFCLLVRRYRPEWRRLLYGICGGDDYLIDECEQELLIRLEKILERYRGDSSLRTYLYRTVRNRGIDVVRKQKRHALFSLDRLEAQEPAGSMGDPEAALIKKEDLARLHRVLGRLKEEERTLLILKDREGLSYEEIASIMGRPLGTVRSRLHRARARATQIGRTMV